MYELYLDKHLPTDCITNLYICSVKLQSESNLQAALFGPSNLSQLQLLSRLAVLCLSSFYKVEVCSSQISHAILSISMQYLIHEGPYL